MSYFKIIILSLTLLSGVVSAECVNSTQMLEQMEEQFVELINESGESVLLRVKVADEGDEQAAGFQYICPEQFKTTAILFVFRQAKKPAFHMNNVYANLDIAFIDKMGLIGDIQLMREEFSTGDRQLYPSEVFTKYALEVEEGFFERNNIKANSSYLKLND